MFKVLIGGRQTGATTKIIDMIREDIENGQIVGIVGKMAMVNRIKDKIHHSQVNKYIKPISNGIVGGFDKIYILNILNLNNELLDVITNRYEDIYCDKPMPLPIFQKIEFDLAREYRNKKNISIEELSELLSLGVDIKLVLEYMKSPLSRKDVRFIRYQDSFGALERLKHALRSPNYNRNGIIFQ